jgi:NDP-sugar pyrophosphorylase family protein
VEAQVLDRLEEDKAVDFTDIIEQGRGLGEKIGVFPVGEEAWLDMGQLEELERMRKELEV